MVVNRQGMNYQAGYTKEELKKKYIAAERQAKKIPTCRELVELGAPSVSYYIKAYGSWNKFLTSIGRPISKRTYTKNIIIKDLLFDNIKFKEQPIKPLRVTDKKKFVSNFYHLHQELLSKIITST